MNVQPFICFAVLLWDTMANAAHADITATRLHALAKPPNDVPGLLHTVAAIAQSGAYSQDDFYTEENLKRLFGDQPRLDIHHYATQIGAYVHGFANLVDAPDAATRASGSAGFSFDARKPYAPDYWKICCKMDVQFNGIFKGLDFVSVTNALGPDWKRNPIAEGPRIREFATEPIPPITAYMGDSTITYTKENITMTLNFDFDGRLSRIHSEWPNPR